jgi:hypothetical protein
MLVSRATPRQPPLLVRLTRSYITYGPHLVNPAMHSRCLRRSTLAGHSKPRFKLRLLHDERQQNKQARAGAQSSDGLAHGAQLGSEDAGGLEGPYPAGAERMDLLGHLGKTRYDAKPPNPARDRGSPGRQTPSLLLAWLSASPTQREEVVRETSALADGLRPEPPAIYPSGARLTGVRGQGRTHLTWDIGPSGQH